MWAPAWAIDAVSLESYRRKRDFSRTPEPTGDGDSPALAPSSALDGTAPRPVPGAAATGGRFVVQRHRARALHYDFRLEIDGVLVSWAVPKGPSLDPSIKRAAFHVEDHPLGYYDFEGTIPAGEYGGGDVIVWDWGTFEPEATFDPGASLRDGELKLVLMGEKLRGRFTIVKTRGWAGGATGRPDQDAWLLIKKRDEWAVPGWDAEGHLESVKTGRTNDQVAEGIAPLVRASEVDAALAAIATSQAATPERPLGKPVSAMPGFIEPMTATLADGPFSDPAWLFELKWDGYRVQAHVRNGRVALYTRRGLDAAGYFPELAGPPTWIDAREAILDGEVVALNAVGEPDFNLLQARRRASKRRLGEEDAASTLGYIVFDLLYLDGRSLVDEPLEARKRLLRSIIRDEAPIQYASHVEGDGEELYRAVAARGLEGVMAKLARSRYEVGRRSTAWLKIKRRAEQEVVVGGWTPREGSQNDLGALLVGIYEGGLLRSAGRVGTGFDARERRRLLGMMAPLKRPSPPFQPPPEEKGVRWIEPTLVVRVEFAEWTADGNLRAASYRGLELDADPEAVARERPETGRDASGVGAAGRAQGSRPPLGDAKVSRDRGAKSVSSTSAQTSTHPGPNRAGEGLASTTEMQALGALPAKGGLWSVAGRQLKLSNLDKVLWPDDGITKRELIGYYAAIAPHLLPYLRDRALTLQRYPDGVDRNGFWQKQVPGHAPDWVECWPWISTQSGATDYLLADSAATLAWVANEAAIDIHPSTFRVIAPDRPTWALIDIDPGQRTQWQDVLLLARLYRTALEHLTVRGFPKVSGQRGIQVWIPVKPVYSFDQTRDWVAGLSRMIAAATSDLVSWEWQKSRRDGLARLDYTQNAWNKTLVAPYSVRPVRGAAVSAPITWDELDDPELRPDRWTLRTIQDRVESLGDLFAPALTLEQELPPL